jgi:hypothetical protein
MVPMPSSLASEQKEPRKLQNRTLRRKNKCWSFVTNPQENFKEKYFNQNRYLIKGLLTS